MAQMFDNPMPAATNGLVATLAICGALLFVVLTVVAYLILVERKVSAWIQDRVGPNRAGPWGLLQPAADVFKLILKEDYTPAHVDRRLFWLGPIAIIAAALTGLAVIPLGGTIEVAGVRVELQIAQIDTGLLFIVAMGALSVYGIVIGGWAANSKYPLLGAMRAAAQLLSYEVPLAIVLISVILVSGTLRLEEMVSQQSGLWWGWLPRWNIFLQPLGFLLFYVCVLAETNRLPFDLPEAEQELVAGYHTEYSSMKFGLYFLAEYTNLLVGSAVAAVLFLGGGLFWGLHEQQTAWYFGLARLAVLMGKMGLIILLTMQLRWTLPRFRFDQLLRLSWTGLVPASLALLVINAVLVAMGGPRWTYPLGNAALVLLIVLAAAMSRAPITGRQKTLGDA